MVCLLLFRASATHGGGKVTFFHLGGGRHRQALPLSDAASRPYRNRWDGMRQEKKSKKIKPGTLFTAVWRAEAPPSFPIFTPAQAMPPPERWMIASRQAGR